MSERYYKVSKDGYILFISRTVGERISETEYSEILSIIRNKPSAENGYDYKLKEDLTWELVELPPEYIEDEEATLGDYEEALGRFGI